MALSFPRGESSVDGCATCHRTFEDATTSWWVPWGNHPSAGRRLCQGCLLTLFRLDTQAEMTVRRANRLSAGGRKIA